jgi:hypothetical protein
LSVLATSANESFNTTWTTKPGALQKCFRRNSNAINFLPDILQQTHLGQLPGLVIHRQFSRPALGVRISQEILQRANIFKARDIKRTTPLARPAPLLVNFPLTRAVNTRTRRQWRPELVLACISKTINGGGRIRFSTRQTIQRRIDGGTTKTTLSWGWLRRSLWRRLRRWCHSTRHSGRLGAT